MKEYFYTITEGMINLGLRGTELNLFAIIFGYSQKGDGCCYTTRRELARRCGVNSTNTIDSAMDSLIKKGLVNKFLFRKDDRELVAYSFNSNFEQGTQKLSSGYAKIEQGRCSKIEHKKNKDSKNNFIPPTIEQVSDYCTTLGFRCPLGFAYFYIGHYDNEEWKRKNGEPMRNWKNNIREVWMKNNKDRDFTDYIPSNKIPSQVTSKIHFAGL